MALLLLCAFFSTACSGSLATSTAALGTPATSKAATTPSSAAVAAPPTAARSVAPSHCDDPLQTGGHYLLVSCQVAAPSLAGNMLGDPPQLTTYVVVPPDFQTSGKRYPVVYVLAGFTDLGTDLASGIAGSSPPSGGVTVPLVVVVSGVNGLGGSFYVNSPVTGNWDDAITHDLIGYIDASFPTIPRREARGIAGVSMGGFGSLNLAMLHPDLFSAVFGEVPGLFDDKDGADTRLADPQIVDQVLALQAQVAGKTPSAAVADVLAATQAGPDVQFELAYGAAFDADPTSPLLMRFPFSKQGDKTVRDDAVWSKWEAGFGDLAGKVQRYAAAWKSYKGIAVDWGTQDWYTWIPLGCQYFVKVMTAAGIPVTASSFDGGHTDQQIDRLDNHMLPFMEGLLATS